MNTIVKYALFQIDSICFIGYSCKWKTYNIIYTSSFVIIIIKNYWHTKKVINSYNSINYNCKNNKGKHLIIHIIRYIDRLYIITSI